MPDVTPDDNSLVDFLDWDLEERDRWMDENDGDDVEDPTEVVVGADE